MSNYPWKQESDAARNDLYLGLHAYALYMQLEAHMCTHAYNMHITHVLSQHIM